MPAETLRTMLAALALVVGGLNGTTATGAEAGERAPSIRSQVAWPAVHCTSPRWCRTSCRAVRGFDEGFFLASRTGWHRVKFGAYVQARAQRVDREDAPAQTNQTVERLRLFLLGTVGPQWAYELRLGRDADGDAGIVLANVTWRPRSTWQLTFGEQFIAVSREDWMYGEDLLTSEYSANDSIFGTGISTGLQARWQDQRHRVYAAVSNGEAGRASPFSGSVANASWAFTARYARQVRPVDWAVWDDLIGRRGRPFGVLLGAGGGVRVGRGEGDGDRWFATADVSVAWSGGQALGYVSVSRGDAPGGARTTTCGALLQAGHFLTPTLQAYGRAEWIGSDAGMNATASYRALTLGFSWLPFRWSNLTRVSLEFARLLSGINHTLVAPSEGLGFLPSDAAQSSVRLQVQLGI